MITRSTKQSATSRGRKMYVNTKKTARLHEGALAVRRHENEKKLLSVIKLRYYTVDMTRTFDRYTGGDHEKKHGRNPYAAGNKLADFCGATDALDGQSQTDQSTVESFT